MCACVCVCVRVSAFVSAFTHAFGVVAGPAWRRWRWFVWRGGLDGRELSLVWAQWVMGYPFEGIS